ncbi:hypothetical protein U9725_21015 [Escherichia coli]
MATTPTNKPIPSEDPRDLKFNAGKIDEVVTSDAHYYTDRFGVRRWTIAGFQYTAEEAIRNYGYITLKSFQLGAPLPNNELTLPNHVLQDETNGEYYRWDGEFPKTVPAGSTPETSGGIGVGAWIGVGDAALRGQLGSLSGLTFNTVGDIFTGTTSSGQTVTLKAGDTVTTGGGTQWRILIDSPSAMSAIKATSPFNVIDFGADRTGVADSTAAFIQAGGALIPTGTYKIESNLAPTYTTDGEVTITGSGTVKILPVGQDSVQKNLPVYINKNTGGILYSDNYTTITANTGEFYREPSMVHTSFNNRVFLMYTVLVGTSFDPGQDANQTSRIEIRNSNNNLSFDPPIVISTEGEQQAAEPCFAFDHKRGRIWCFYTTARGRVGVGHGSTGFDPNTTFQNWMTYSDNYGTQWTNPVNITTSVKPENATSAWFSPSPLCVTGDGDLLVPYAWILNGGVFYHGYIRVSENADGTFKYNRQLILAGGTEGSNGAGELQITQLGDGSLLALIRDYYNDDTSVTKGRQRVYRSFDSVNWIYQSSIDTTNCKAGMCLYSSMSNGDSRDVLLVTAPTGDNHDYRFRNDLRTWVSTNNGVSWTEFTGTMFDDPGLYTGYSTITPVGSGGFMSITEGQNTFNFLRVKHRAIGAFSGVSNYAKSWGKLPSVIGSQENALCASYDIPQLSLFWNSDSRTLKANIFGSAVQLSTSAVTLTVSTPTTFINSNNAGIYYLSASMTLNEITGNADKVLLVSTTSSQPITLQESTSIPIERRIRVNKTLSAAAIMLYRTSTGWWADRG